MKIALQGTGCVCVLLHVEEGAPLQAFGNVPPALQGATWASVRTWACLLWHKGRAHVAQLKGETKAPPTLDSLISHMERCPERWAPVTLTKAIAP